MSEEEQYYSGAYDEEEEEPPKKEVKAHKHNASKKISKPKKSQKAEADKPAEAKVEKPKRKCTAKQLAALAAGRAKNAEMRAKRKALKDSETKKDE